MAEFAAVADIIRMSDVDFEYLYGNNDYAGRAASMLEAGASLVVITRGVEGVQAWHGTAGTLQVETPKVEVVDTIGAGDSFQAALLFALHALGRIAMGRCGRSMQTNCAARCRSRQPARPSPAGGSAPIRHGARDLTSGDVRTSAAGVTMLSRSPEIN